MLLLNGPNTPFGRMALVTALELEIALDHRIINVFECEMLDPLNPLRQIPTLILDDGRMVCDSRVICDYFCSLRPERGFNSAQRHWDVQTRWSLALGLMDTAVAWVMERLRPPAQQSEVFLHKCGRRFNKVIAHWEADSAEICISTLRIDRLAIAIALEYIDFRQLHDWRRSAPCLARWMETETVRPSLVSSRPRERLLSDPVTFELSPHNQ